MLDISHMGLISAVLDDSELSENGKKQALVFLRQKNSHELAALCRDEIFREDVQCKINRPSQQIQQVGILRLADSGKAEATIVNNRFLHTRFASKHYFSETPSPPSV